MVRFAIAVLMASAASAQLTTDVLQKAPPAIDEALRARIAQFYQLHVDGKFRQAEQLVAEDSKDFFYTSNKPKYIAFEINRIDYSDNFTKAKATIVCQMYVMMPGFAGKPLPVPTPSLWKVVDGQWYWYVDPDSVNRTPFGKMKGGAEGAGSVTSLPALPSPEEAVKMVERVKADKSEIRLDPGAPSTAEITFTNGMPGPITLTASAPALDGLEIKPGQPAIKAGETGTMNFLYKPGKAKPAGPVTITIRVEQTGQSFPVRITFAKQTQAGTTP